MKRKKTSKPKSKRKAKAAPPRRRKPGEPKRKTGPKPSATPDVLKRICDNVGRGDFFAVACDCEGLDRSWARKLLRDGARELRRMAAEGLTEPDEKLKRQVDFALDLRIASAKAESEAVSAIRKAGLRQWQALAWYLERKHWERWGRKERHELTGKNGGPVAMSNAINPDRFKHLTEEELRAYERALGKLTDDAGTALGGAGEGPVGTGEA